MTWVTVHQLTTRDKGLAFLNVDEEYGRIDVWGSIYSCPTYLLQAGLEFHIVQFDNQAYADEFIEENEKNYDKVTRLVEERG